MLRQQTSQFLRCASLTFSSKSAAPSEASEATASVITSISVACPSTFCTIERTRDAKDISMIVEYFLSPQRASASMMYGSS